MELTIDQALQKAIEAHKAGQIQEADRFYTAILKAQPKHPDANHNLGVLAVSVGKANEALPFLKAALEANPSIAQFWLSYIDVLIKMGRIADAKAVLAQATSKGAKGEGFDRLDERIKEADEEPVGKISKVQEPPKAQINELVNLYSQGQLAQTLNQANTLIKQFPNSANLFNIQGAVLRALGQLDLSVDAYKKALAIKPDYTEAYNNMGVTLKEQGKLEEAIEACNKALSLKPDYAEAYYNMGNALRDQGKLEEAIEAYNKALTIKPDYAEAYNNMGVTHKEQSKLEEAIEAYNKALAIKPDHAEAYNSKGNALRDQGKLEEAIEAYNKALTIKPDYAEAHRHLSILTKYNSDTAQISTVVALLERTDLNNSDRCNLLYTHAKMQEDVGDLRSAFESYVAGGDLRKKLLAYESLQDERLFARIKQTAPHFKDAALNATSEPIRHTPIFILGMPRSGTTLVEQIISSHSKVTGAGELDYVSEFGGQLAKGLKVPTSEALAAFRNQYIVELSKRAAGQPFVTDKMPQNFRYIALICAAIPEAKIIHVQRNSKATCWSNFKHYFASKGLGYSYNLSDTVKYHELYKDLMHFWYQSYDDRIYNLDYDKLTDDQESETRRLIEYLGLNWEESCLAPEENKRSVITASSLQVRQEVYTGSSQAWRKFEPFLDGIFEQLED